MALTRAQRRALQKDSSDESEEKQQQTDLATETTPTKANHNEATLTDQQVIQKVKKVHFEQELESEASSESSDNEEDDNESSSEEEGSDDNDSSEEEEADDEDLDALLEKAEKALTKQQLDGDKGQIKLDTEEDDNDKKFNLPKMDSRVTIDNELYIRRAKGEKVARLVDGTVDVIDHDDNKKNRKHKKVVEAIKEREKEEKERLSRKERKEEREKTAGRGWFDMGRPDMTPELKRDLQLLKMRHVIDRKRHYKKMGKESAKYFQVGTVIEGATEFHSSRLTRKERKETIVDELMANEQAKDYYKRKYNEGQTRGNNGRKKAKRQMKRL
ncbi:Fcf2 pre-rRNA processing-domain-containing protein [Phascolomyces articulosus]|uniref:Fcf2 pre-rRNA processing-domain-containing protein n=1 Tax=Phascolomyces articulosus TaxID=60185 RepID=A0AAD5KRK1_9FUNG|nr:Fcf2 pre-rRNA processing-domain-containing protein [Phascolomyces articulosus]